MPTGTVDYIRFGSGQKTLIMIPGVGDGLKTVKGMALPFAFLYRSLAKNFTVYVFSRRRNLSPGMTTRDMAEDLNSAMDTAERSYSEKRLKQTRLVYRLIGSIGKPMSFERFRIQAASCVMHDAYDLLDHIICPTLVTVKNKKKCLRRKQNCVNIFVENAVRCTHSIEMHGGRNEFTISFFMLSISVN